MKETNEMNQEEKIQYLKDLIQRIYDKDNWNGISSQEKLLSIAANVELLGYGVIFEPIYNCPA